MSLYKLIVRLISEIIYSLSYNKLLSKIFALLLFFLYQRIIFLFKVILHLIPTTYQLIIELIGLPTNHSIDIFGRQNDYQVLFQEPGQKEKKKRKKKPGLWKDNTNRTCHLGPSPTVTCNKLHVWLGVMVCFFLLLWAKL